MKKNVGDKHKCQFASYVLALFSQTIYKSKYTVSVSPLE